MRRRVNRINARGKVRKTLDIAPPAMRWAEAILKTEKRPRSFTALLEDLIEAEHKRICPTNGHKAAA